jgi:uncharacterized membrane protein
MDSTRTNQQQNATQNRVPYPNLPPLIDSRASEYYGSGNTSTISILGHPIHPIIVIFPIAFLSGAAGSDIGYWLTRDFFWARASMWLIGLGLLSGIAAAVVGASDFFKIPKVRQRRAGWGHMITNVTALILTLVNYLLRLGNSALIIIPVGMILSIAVALLLLVGGWFGGELTFRHKVGAIGAGDTEVS